ncbi:MAG TPA: DUF2520 domain-containing protein [Chitinophagales bacterium]|nr:DUF2520 domain-containing protein [Chitinophagales bacterium]
MKIAILGAGNVGYQLAWHLNNNGHQIVQVFSRHLPAAKFIGNLMDIACTDKIEEITKGADIYLLSIRDDAIEEVVKQLRLGDKVIAHTSGTVPMKILEQVSTNYGIFYPLQTLSRNVSVDFGVLPICLTASNDFTKKTLIELAGTLTSKIVEVDDEKRLAIHIAGVFANNFTNHLFSVSQMVLEKTGLSFEIMKPLINETVRKIQNHDPLNVQTGPAIRHDDHTIERHLKFLEEDGRFAALYKILSDDIRKYAKEN